MEHQEDETGHPSQNNPPKTRKSRGATIGKGKATPTAPLAIEFTESGQPIGPNRKTFQTYLGVLSRRISITIMEWENIEKGLLDSIWLDAQKKFSLENSHKDWVLRGVRSRWTDFKSRLSGEYVYKSRKPKRKVPLENPLSIYHFISPAQWEEFVKQCQDPKFKAKSDASRESGSKNKNPHTMDRKGYIGSIPGWIQEEVASASADGQDTTMTQESVTSRLQDQSYRWIKGHTPASGKSIPEETQKVIDGLMEWQEKAQQGSFVPGRYEDALTKATEKPEHPGRLRGAGKIGFTTYFPPQPSQTGSCRVFTEEGLKEFESRVKQETIAEVTALVHRQTLDILRAAGVQFPTNIEMNMMSSPHIGSSSCQSIDPDPFSLLQVLLNPKKTNRKGKKKVESKGSSNRPRASLVSDEVLASLPQYTRALHDSLASTFGVKDVIQVPIESEIFQYDDDILIPVSVEDICQLFTNSWLNISILQIWGKYLWTIANELGMQNLSFLCPERLSSCNTSDKTRFELQDYVSQVLLNGSSTKRYFIGAYYERDHWMAVVIVPKFNFVYILDSLHRDQRSLTKLKMCINWAFKIYCTKGGAHNTKKAATLSWSRVECPQQPSGYECGYYVMKFLYDIVTQFAYNGRPK